MAALLSFAFAKSQTHKARFAIGLYTTANTTINGIAAGIGSNTYQNSNFVSVYSNGIRVEPLSQSLLFFTLFLPVDSVNYPYNPLNYEAFGKKIPNEVINGLNLSCGTNAFASVNGITISVITQSLKNTNGISIAGIGSESFRNNGIQIAGAGTTALYSNGLIASMLSTTVYKGNGLQIAVGFTNYVHFTGLQIAACNGANDIAESFTGLQIGIFNTTKKLRGIQIGLINKNEKRILPFFNWNFKD